MKNCAAIRVRAFTLIEVLVVLAVIAVLAAILLPVLSSAKARAQRTACMNNLRQINVGIHLYADENGDTLPDVGRGTLVTYQQAIKSYLGLNGLPSPTNRLFACPMDTFYYDFDNGAFVPSGFHLSRKYDYTSYFFNGANLITNYINMIYNGVLPGIGGQKISAVKNPARTALAEEACALAPYSWHRPQSLGITPAFNNARDILSYVDGHLDYTRMYWNSTLLYPNQAMSLAAYYDPPPGYDYQWSGN
jgi:prepilin-type N-terminal cleavage/methylation domain-containing protein